MKPKVPPPIVAFGCAGLMWLVARLVPQAGIAIPARGLIAGILFVIGLSVAACGVMAFRRARTTVNPLKPENASSLVRSGIYRFTRNPMYLGLLVGLLAWSVLLANPFVLIFLPLFVFYLNRFQIGPEEAALEAKFGNDFLDYKSEVRRWL